MAKYTDEQVLAKMKEYQSTALNHLTVEGRTRGRSNLRTIIKRHPDIARINGIAPIDLSPRGEPTIPLTKAERKEFGLE
jgi:hypothetical protein